MSRRDTIIIAMLVNACLLALLFILAVNTEGDHVIDHPEIAKTIVDNHPQAPVNKVQSQNSIVILDTSVHDEVDSFLKDLASENVAESFLVDEDGYIELKKDVKITAQKPEKKEIMQTSDDANYVEVTVKRGDALEKIARSNGTTVEALKKANNLTSAKLSIGQVLRVPLSDKIIAEPIKPIAVVQPQKESASEYYVIKSGDNPWKIAKQFNVKFEDLLRLNNLDEERARNLKIGDKVRVK
jgi:peptidoglycan endopeptidase LytF